MGAKFEVQFHFKRSQMRFFKNLVNVIFAELNSFKFLNNQFVTSAK
jgi:hypothetical protein